MDTETMTLTDFLLARFAEDEAAVRDGMVGIIALSLATRILAECEAKRRIIELHQPTSENLAFSMPQPQWEPTCSVCVNFHADMDCENEPWPCVTLRALALPYGGHPDCLQEWAL